MMTTMTSRARKLRGRDMKPVLEEETRTVEFKPEVIIDLVGDLRVPSLVGRDWFSRVQVGVRDQSAEKGSCYEEQMAS